MAEKRKFVSIEVTAFVREQQWNAELRTWDDIDNKMLDALIAAELRYGDPLPYRLDHILEFAVDAAGESIDNVYKVEMNDDPPAGT